MDGGDFQELFDLFPAMVLWQRSIPCPCVTFSGAADQTCVICGGRGRSFAAPSAPVEVALVSQSARNRSVLAQTMGPGATGSSVLIVPVTAPFYNLMAEGDRFYDTMVIEQNRTLVAPNVKVSIPLGATDLQAFVRSPDKTALIPAPFPAMDSLRRIEVAVTTAINFRAPRAYEAVKELGTVRSFGEGLPKRWTLNLLDLTMR